MPLARWWIEGTLTTVSPLHIGDGSVTTRADLINPKTDKLAEINAVAVVPGGAAYLPGSTIKGCLRAWLEDRGFHRRLIDCVFGPRPAENEPQRLGGKADFHDAFFAEDGETRQRQRWWDATRKGCVAPGVSIDRVTRTALDERLFYYEYVPPKVSFDLRILLRDVELGDGEVALVLAALESCGKEDGVRMGAATNEGWGVLNWRRTALMRADKVSEWLVCDATTPWTKVSEAEAARIERLAADQKAAARNGDRLSLTVRLTFDSHFLVNDPSQCKSDQERDPDRADHAPVLEDGEISAPASSIRGVLRSQAERILRTMAQAGAPVQAPGRDAAGDLKAVEGLAEAKTLPLYGKLFGAAGWRSPLRFRGFRPADRVPGARGFEFQQEFVAIDRFTGGGEEGKKFNAKSRYQPVLDGKIEMDLAAFERSELGPEAFGLLALTLRDLMEGDVVVGFGGAKGYGSCRASIIGAELSGAAAARLLGEQTANAVGQWEAGQPMPAPVQEYLTVAVRRLQLPRGGGR